MLEDCSPPLRVLEHSSARRWCFSQRHRFKAKRTCQNKCREQTKPSIRLHFAARCLAQFAALLNFLIQASSALRYIARHPCKDQATRVECAIRAGAKVLNSVAFVRRAARLKSPCTHRCSKKYDVEVTGLLQTTFATLGSKLGLAGSLEAELKADQSEFL